MRIVIVSQFYPPEPVPLPEELARSLAQRGHEVCVVTGVPNYPSGDIYEGYNNRFRSTESDGRVLIRRVPLVASHSDNPVARFVNYLSFAASALSASGIARRAEAVYVYGTPMTAAIPALFWNRLFATPFVVHVQDLWPESITGSRMLRGSLSRLAGALVQPLLERIYRSASAVVAIAPSMLRMLRERGVAEDRSELIYNWATSLPVEPRKRLTTLDRRLKLLYAGNLGEMQDLESIIRACAHLEGTPGFSLTIAGDGIDNDRLRRIAADLHLSNVEFVGRLPPESLEELYDACDFQIVTLKALTVFSATIPSKFQASVARGIPVITTVGGDLSALVVRHNLGLIALAENPDDIARAFKLALDVSADDRSEMSRACTEFAEQKFSRESNVADLERLLRRSVQVVP